MMLGLGAGLFAPAGGALLWGLGGGTRSSRFNASCRTPGSESGSVTPSPASSPTPQALSVTTIFGVDANVTVVSDVIGGQWCSASDAVGSALMIAANARACVASRFTRSEEHTSELQSLTNLVCRLL